MNVELENQAQADDHEITAGPQIRVRYPDGHRELMTLALVTNLVTEFAAGLPDTDVDKVAGRVYSGMYDGIPSRELDKLLVQVPSALIAEDPEYSRLAARFLDRVILDEVESQGISDFASCIRFGHEAGIVSDVTAAFVEQNAAILNPAIDPRRADLFRYFGLRTVYDRYLLRHPISRKVFETPQYFFLRVACGLSQTPEEAIEFYRLISSLEYLTSSPTLFNSGTRHSQMSSCYLLDSPGDSLEGIYKRYMDIAQLSKFAGGIGVAWHRIRARGSLIRGTNGKSNGIVPWLKTLDASVAAVNQCFAPDMPVFTAEGSKPISEVQPGDLVLGQRGEYREVQKHFTYNEHGAMVSLNIKHSIKPVQVTTGHPFWAIQGVPMEQACSRTLSWLERGKVAPRWVDAGELRRGDYVAQVIPTEVIVVPDFTEDDARLYGIMLGDGHLASTGYEWGLSGNPQKDSHLAFVRSYLERRGIHFWETERGEAYAQIRWSAGRGVERCADTGRFTGMGEPTLPFGRDDLYDDQGRKRISRRLSHLPPNQTLAIVQGLIETDGGISRGKEICFTNTSEPLIEGLRYQLLRLGVPSAGQYRERKQDHTGTRSNGETIQFKGTVCAFDLRIPAVPEIAARVGCAPIHKRSWLIHNGWLWSRVRSAEPMASLPTIHDLKVDGDETYMTAAALVHNGGRRKGACCVYLEPWHPDIEEFLELRDNTGDEARRTYNLNLANWIPNLFMQRVQADEIWSLFDPKDVPELVDAYGEEFERIYEAAERDGRYMRQVKAQDLYSRMMRTLAQTGNGWMTFKDHCNEKSNQTGKPGNVVHSSNLCTEIVEITHQGETAVCNLGSLNLSRFLEYGEFNFEKLRDRVKTAVKYLDRVIDINYYPTPEAAASNHRWRPVGLGLMGLQDVFFMKRMSFDSPEASRMSARIQEEVYYAALSASCDLAEKYGAHESFADTRAAQGVLQFDLWGVKPESLGGTGQMTLFGAAERSADRWEQLKERIKRHGLRNSLLIAIAPTATIASISGCYECTEPQVSNLFKRETLSGEFLQVNRYLVADLKRLGMWNERMRDLIKEGEGSIQHIAEIPQELRDLYRTAWELPQKALIDMAADRSPYVDQSASLNLFMKTPTIGKLSSMYAYAWRKGLKTTYYLRSRPATRIASATSTTSGTAATPVETAAEARARLSAEQLACSLENPEACEMCQ